MASRPSARFIAAGSELRLLRLALAPALREAGRHGRGARREGARVVARGEGAHEEAQADRQAARDGVVRARRERKPAQATRVDPPVVLDAKERETAGGAVGFEDVVHE